MEEKAKLTNYKILIISFIAWTLTNMDQAFFGYAIPGILEEFDLPLEVAGLILTTSFVIASVMLLFTGAAADRFGRGPMLSLYLGVSALLVGLQGVAGGIFLLTVFRSSDLVPDFLQLRMPMLWKMLHRVYADWRWGFCNAAIL